MTLTMASSTPMHPYDIMLCGVSKLMGKDKEVMHRLGRTMGLRKTSQIECPSLLFQRFEDEDKLSEFHVVHFYNALNSIDLHKAADLVKQYEETQLKAPVPSQSGTDEPPPYSFQQSTTCKRESQDTSGIVTSSDEIHTLQETSIECQSDESTKPSPDPELPMTETAEEVEEKGRELNSMDCPPKTKYKTVTLATLQRDYGQMNGFTK